MRLINVHSFMVKEFTPVDIPKYAILSHRWAHGPDREARLDDIKRKRNRSTKGYQKVLAFIKYMRHHLPAVEWVWIDTCCIDQDSSAELSEAIISMFRWYHDAEVCLAYLADVRPEDQVGSVQLMRDFNSSEWFARGWTLQELLAPRLVVFMTKTWEVIGHKGNADNASLLPNFPIGPLVTPAVTAITGIPEKVLQDFERSKDCDPEDVFTWMKDRKTVREEDMSYSLLGIFDVGMGAMYGEGGDKAHRRLLRELKEVNHDRLHMIQLSEVVESLKFAQMDSRHATISAAYAKTCRWIFDRAEYTQWCSRANFYQHHGFLWIKGNPGVGKSTLMKCIFEEARKKSRAATVISFFFNARGETLEKSTEGMYRSLLYQLVNALPSLADLLYLPSMPSQGYQAWPLDLLKDLFARAIKGLGQNRVACYIDALDECQRPEVRDLAEFLQDLGESILDTGVAFDVCLSSRHFPQITVRHCLELNLDGQEGHQQDITDYVVSKLHGGSSRLMNEIRATICQRASGIFLWVVLVVRILNEEQDRGNVHMLRKRLGEIPDGLSALFDDILSRDPHNHDEMLLALQWILYASRPLSCEEFHFGVLSGFENPLPQPWISGARDYTEEEYEEYMRRRVLDVSKGLAEVTKGERQTVQFIHESVRGYLLGNGVQRLAPDLSHNFEGFSNERLKECCQRFITKEVLTQLKLAHEAHEALGRHSLHFTIRDTTILTYPFLSYAVNSIFKHANAGQRCGVPQDKFMASLESKLWVALANVVERYAKRRHTDQVTMTYLFALHDCQYLLELAIKCGHPIKRETEKYGSALGACIGNGNIAGASMLLERGAVPNLVCSDGCTYLQLAYKRRFDHMIPLLLRSGCQIDSLLSQAAQDGRIAVAKSIIEWEAETHADVPYALTTLTSTLAKNYKKVARTLLAAGIEIGNEGRPGPSVLQAAIIADFSCRPDQVGMLIEAGANVNAQGGYYGNPLQAASYLGFKEIVNKLLENGANVNAQGGLYPNALQAASHHALGDTVDVLIKAGANVNATGGNYGTALQAASLGDHQNVLLLLKADADVNLQAGYWGNALQAASFWGNDQTVRALLKARANVNAQGGFFGNALQAASHLGNNQIVRMLLEARADVNAQGGQFGTALQAASAAGHVEVVQMLLGAGADVNLQGGPAGNALQAASHGGHEKVVRALLAKADANATGRTCQTGQDYRMEVVRTLPAAGASHNASPEPGAWLESSDMIVDD